MTSAVELTGQAVDYAPDDAFCEAEDMAKKRVDLDAMIPREDFDVVEEPSQAIDLIKDFPLSALAPSSHYLKLLRKPDFQRETTHWTPEQVVGLISSFVDNEVIPALILWRAPSFMFVIDGGHRLSALRSWIEDDYGDGVVSQLFYGTEISQRQKDIAKTTRQMVEKQVGRYSALQGHLNLKTAPELNQRRAQVMLTRALPLQWIQGNSKVAESSFFKINKQGTALDETEEMLIRNREKPLAISSRAILRAGTGHKYWSDFSQERREEIEGLAVEFHDRFFKPEASEPLKTLDLPVGGTISPVDAQALLVDFLTIAGNREKEPKTIALYSDDLEGGQTVAILKNAFHVLNRMSGNHSASLGLHPAVYFYNERGTYSRFMFLGMVTLIQEALRNHNSYFFIKFTAARAAIEDFLIQNKSAVGFTLQNMAKAQRVRNMKVMYEYLLETITAGHVPTLEELIGKMGFKGRIVDVKAATTTANISDDTKSIIYVKSALSKAQICPLCGGRLDPSKSVSYDHIKPVRAGGLGTEENVQMVHPFCNTGYKEHLAAKAARQTP